MFWLALVLPIFTIISAVFKGYYFLLPLADVFLVHPIYMILNFFFKEDFKFFKYKSYWLLYLSAPLTAVVLYVSLMAMNYVHGWGIFYIILNCALSGGTFSMISAHELIHKKNKYLKTSGLFNFFLTGYPQFPLAHLNIHHRYVGSKIDPSTARFNESVYHFVLRSFIGNTINAFKLDGLTIKNRMAWYTVMLAALIWAIYYMFGELGVILYLTQSAIGIFLLETIEYIEHYGVERLEKDGKLEPFHPSHSWDTYENATNYRVFNLGFHSDHHARPNLDYFQLEKKEEALILPYGYSNMVFISFVPCLWFRIMNPLIEKRRTKKIG